MRTKTLALASCLATSLFCSSLVSQHVLYAKQGDGSSQLFGGNVRSAGDVDADGYDDFVAGAPNPSGLGRARVHSGKDGRLLHSFVGTQVGSFFGVSVSGAGDVNNDGHDDIVVGASSYSVLPGKREGMIKVFSGKDGSVLYTQTGYHHDSEFGFSVSGAGDVNQDGFDDFIAGAFLEDLSYWDSGSARVFSGKDGTVLYTFSGDEKFTSYGLNVNGPGDINKDGYADVFVGAPRDDDSGKTNCGSATLYSGKDGSVLRAWFGDTKNDELGFNVGPAGDVDKDGFLDLIIGVPLDDNTATNAGSARVVSGQDGSILYSYDGMAANDWFGWAVTGGGDLDMDGHSDFVISAFFADPNGTDSGSVYVYSGKTGTQLTRFDGEAAGDWYGQSIAMLGDINKDGHADFVIGAERENSNNNDAGTVYAISGKRLSMWTNTQELLLSQAGQQVIKLDFGASQAGRSYWIFGSIVGMYPGVKVGGVPIDLIPDLYTEVVMVHTNTSTYTDFRGTLDASGRATARFNLPGGLPAMPELSLYHAAVVFDISTGAFFTASNPAPLRLKN